jgi:class 3 adenylate cyclase
VRDVAGERRHLTILFCDLVGSTAMAAQLDPEEWRATVAGYQGAAAAAITRFGGEVVRYGGDGIMAFFGLPSGPWRADRQGVASYKNVEPNSACGRRVSTMVDQGLPRVRIQVAPAKLLHFFASSIVVKLAG